MIDATAQAAEERSIVDAHMHLWSLHEYRFPWLQDPDPIDFRYGNYSPLCGGAFLPEDYRRVSCGWTVSAVVAIEAEWKRGAPVDETAWISSVAGRCGMPHAFVAHAPLNAPDVAHILDAHAAYPLVRDIRHKPADPRCRGNLLDDDAWRSGYARLGAHGFHFELQAPFELLGRSAALAEQHLEIPVVVNHAALPFDRSHSSLLEWQHAVRAIARVPHVVVKLSGLGGRDGRWECDANRTVIRRLIDVFGPERCMFASKYPVDSFCVGFDRMYECYRAAVADLSKDERHALLHDNAARFYRVAAAYAVVSPMVVLTTSQTPEQEILCPIQIRT